MLFCYVLIVQLCALSVLGANKTATNKEDEAVARTLSRIYAGAESGRLIGLFCRARCLKQRELVRFVYGSRKYSNHFIRFVTFAFRFKNGSEHSTKSSKSLQTIEPNFISTHTKRH